MADNSASITLPDVTITPNDKPAAAMTVGQGGGAPGFSDALNLAVGGGLGKLPEAISPADAGSAGRIAGHAGMPEQAEHDPTLRPGEYAPAQPLPPAMRDEYSRALLNGEVDGPRDFAEHLTGAAWKAAGAADPSGPEDTPALRSAQATGAASAIAATLPTHEDLIDYGAALSHQAYNTVTPGSANVVKQNLLDHWADTGEMPAEAYRRAQADPSFHAAMTQPKPAPLAYPGAYGLDEGASLTGGTEMPNILDTLHKAAEYLGLKPSPEDWQAQQAQHDKEVKEALVGVENPTERQRTLADVKAPTQDPLTAMMVGSFGTHNLEGALFTQATAGAVLRKGLARTFMSNEHFQQYEQSAKSKGFVQKTVTEETGLAERQKKVAAAVLDQYRAGVNKHMDEYRQWLPERQAYVASVAQAKADWVAGGGDPARFSNENPTFDAPARPVIAHFLDFVEGRSIGKAIMSADHPLYEVANALREVVDHVKAQMIELHPEMARPEGWAGMGGFIEDYYRHLWTRPGDADRIFGSGKQGSSASLKERKIPTLSEGIDRGLVPRILNPIDNTLHYTAGMMDYIAAERVRQISRDMGYIKYSTSRPPNPGWVPLNGRASTLAAGDSGAIQRAFAPAGFARSYNYWISKGFYDWADKGKVYDTVQKFSNTQLAFKLGVSGFHAFNIAKASLASRISSAIGNLAQGDVGALINDLGNSALGIAGRGKGSRILNAYLHPEDMADPFAQRLADLAAKSGLRVTGRGVEYRVGMQQNLWKAVKNGSLKHEIRDDAGKVLGANDEPIATRAVLAPGRAVGFLAHQIGRVADTMMSPLFDEAIPRLKVSAWSDEMEMYMRRNPGASDGQLVAHGQVLTKTMDNRFGEMNQDMLFWRREIKQTLNALTVSVGWAYGTLRSMGTGLRDIGTGHIMSPNARFLIAYPMAAAAIASIYQYMKTGSMPATAAAAMMPATGGRTPEGQIEHARIPGEEKEPIEIIHDLTTGSPLDYFARKGNGTAQLGVEAAKDAGDLIRGKKWGDLLADIGDAFKPITFENRRLHGTGISKAESYMGISHAPWWWEDPRGFARYQERKARAEARHERNREHFFNSRAAGPNE